MTTENSTLLSVTEPATIKLKEILDEQGTPDAFLRITLAPGGHGGAQYILGLEAEADEEDTIVDAGGVRVLVDTDSAPLIEGTNIDYVDGFERSGFVISNPNIQSGGGCGGAGGCACGGGGAEAQQGCGGGGGGGCACGGGGGGHAHGEDDGHGHEAPQAGGCACGGH
ncbi:MAG: iron-sulfur cluster assembly accessory protein [Chloroflexi bacterium]|nr:iron-sulfur cluster assembly accessory protein [Chloroflexota bacterium]